MAKKPGKSRRTLASYGTRGDLVRALIDARRGRVEVKYRDLDGIPRIKTFANSEEGRDEARTWALAYHTTREQERVRREALARGELKSPILTVRSLWNAYVESPAYSDLRETSRRNYKDRFRAWMSFIGPDAHADDTTLHDTDRFRMAYTKTGAVLNSVRQVLNVVRIVYNWGQSRDLLVRNRMALYRWKSPKETPEGVTVGYEPGEYTEVEMEAMIASLSPQRHDQWRAWCALMLMRYHGQRARAIRHLRVTDIDFEQDRLTWAARFQKQGKDVLHPIPWETLSVFLTAMAWRAHEMLNAARKAAGARVRGRAGRFEHDPAVPVPVLTLDESPWLLFAQQDKTKPYSYSSLHYQIIQAETRAGIDHEDYRAAHGFRRGVVGAIGEATGDRMLGLEYVGDTDAKQLKSYDKRRQARIDRAGGVVSGSEK